MNASSTALARDTRSLAVAALLAALLAASAWVAVPLGPVPLTLQVFIVVLIALLMPPIWSAAAVGSYLLLGAVGIPVFAGPRGGLGVLAGPTGGFLLGFFAGATVAAALRGVLHRRGVSAIAADAAAALTTLVIVYLAGWAQLALVAGVGGVEAAAMGVAPFVVVDLAKAAAAVATARVLRRVGAVPD